MDTIEATGVLVRSEDGWRVCLELDNGVVLEQEDAPFETKEAAQAALDSWIAATGSTATRAQ
jgi:hypothetical protein